MDQDEISAALAYLPLGGLRFFDSIGSTNDEALAWVGEGAQDLSMVVADEQTAGRGRSGQKWFTSPGSALAFSLILRPSTLERTVPARITGLGALALAQCCADLGITARIKWPNDILLNGRKAAGILVESAWAGNVLDASVLGIGLNVAATAVPPASQVTFPATSLETELGRPLERVGLLRDIVAALLAWRSQIASRDFIRAWEDALAFRGEEVLIGRDGERLLSGKLLGLETDGSLRLMSDDMPTIVHFGEIHLRPTDDRIG
jgi:BirA family biotin operon repressor/biotin-[acetyl-CoA-carboxylase] ligase